MPTVVGGEKREHLARELPAQSRADDERGEFKDDPSAAEPSATVRHIAGH